MSQRKEVPTCVCTLMNFKIFAACKQFSTVRLGALEWLLTGVHSNMIDELVFRFERPQITIALLPQALVVGGVGSAHVFGVDVLNDALHRVKAFHTRSGQLIRVDPETGQVAFNWCLIDRIRRTVAAQRVRRQRMMVQDTQLACLTVRGQAAQVAIH